MRRTNDEMENANNQSKKEVISAMSKSTIMQAHHGTKNESGNKEAILAELQVSKHREPTWVESPPLIAKETEIEPGQKPNADVAAIMEES